MHELNSLRELFRHADWANDRLLGLAAALGDEQLDRAFEMGFGTLRLTLCHIHSANQVWLQRLRSEEVKRPWAENERPALAELRVRTNELRQDRDAFVGSLSDRDLLRPLDYTNMKGERLRSLLRDILLHVANHAAHHHAQASNMLRHLGVKAPRLDYIFMIYEQQPPPPKLSTQIVKEYFAQTDWARDRVLNVAIELDNDILDRHFEMGIGSIRKNLVHTHDAEAWWLQNWLGHTGTFPKVDDRISISELRSHFEKTQTNRNEYLSALSDDDLTRSVKALASPDRVIEFPLGVTMLQLCNHGTHHRAQTINMLRQCGKSAPGTDLILMNRTSL